MSDFLKQLIALGVDTVLLCCSGVCQGGYNPAGSLVQGWRVPPEQSFPGSTALFLIQNLLLGC